MSIIDKQGPVWEAAHKLPSGHSSALVSWDVLRAVENSEYYDGIVTYVKFTMADWVDVGNGNMMPEQSLANKICEARGIIGTDNSVSEPIYQEIDINRLYCKFDSPKMCRMHVGYACTKSGQVMMEDGSLRDSMPATRMYNVWERLCADAFGPEEEATDYYNPDKVQVKSNGAKYVVGHKRGGGTYEKYLKYDTRAKRQQAFDKEMKFAAAKADTKARNMVIRILTGMTTGYKEADLKSILNSRGEGILYFHRVQQSKDTQKLVIGAKVKKLMGETLPDLDAAFDTDEQPEQLPQKDVTPAPAKKEEEPLPTMYPADVLKYYADKGLTKDQELVDKMVNYLENTPVDTPAYPTAQDRAVAKIAQIEEGLSKADRLNYQLKEK